MNALTIIAILIGLSIRVFLFYHNLARMITLN